MEVIHMIADKILINGKIYTENPAMPWAEAMAISGKLITYVGDNKGAEALASKDTEITDLKGKTVIPGLIDGHTHPDSIATTYWYIRGPLTKDKDQLLTNIRKAAEEHPKEEMPYFYYENYFTETFGDKGPNKELLDEIINDRPARIQDFGDHACWYNSIALNMLKDENGIPHNDNQGGTPEFVKDENNEYTGWAYEAMPEGDTGIYETIGWRPESLMTDETVGPFLDYLKQYGVSALSDAIVYGEENMKYISDLDKAGKLNMFYDAFCLLGTPETLDDTIAVIRDWQEKYTTEHVHCNVVKFFLDGTNELGDCLSTEAFHNDPTGTDYGTANASMEQMRDIMVRLNKERIDLHIHCICDGAFRLMCDATEAAQKICADDWSIKVTLAHCELIHPDDLARPKQLGIYLDHSTHWAGGYFGETAQLYHGKARWDTMQCFRGAIDAGDKVGFSSDTYSYQEASRANPFIGMQTAMTRIDPWEAVRLPADKYPNGMKPPYDGALTIEELIHGYTVINAERMRLDDRIGSLQEGKLANMVIFNEDIFAHAYSDPMTFGSIEPYCTYFEGKEEHIISTLKKAR